MSQMWKKAGAFLQREIFRRRLPHGLFGPAYLLPGADRRIRQHRQIWWQGLPRLPRPLWLMLEILLWLRWIVWHAAPAINSALERAGPRVEALEGIPLKVQKRQLRRLALAWSVPPSHYYQFHLYRDPGRALDYIYDSEVASYHRWRNRQHGLAGRSALRLQDKARLTRELAQQGLPMAPILALVSNPAEDAAVLEQYLAGHDRLFCKMNSGNQGRAAFAVWREAGHIVGQSFTGKPLPDRQAVANAWQALRRLDDVLIQPYLQNHPRLQALAGSAELITVRFISQWRHDAPDRLDCLSAVLEVPMCCADEGETLYAILPVDALTGVSGSALVPLSAEPAVAEALADIGRAARALGPLPGWPDLREHSFLAHRLLDDVQAIAWDWALTAEGPLLLEGNGGWATRVPQVIHGGFLKCP